MSNQVSTSVKFVNKRLLFSAYMQGKRDQIYWPITWEELAPIGKYRVMKQFLKWYSTTH